MEIYAYDLLIWFFMFLLFGFFAWCFISSILDRVRCKTEIIGTCTNTKYRVKRGKHKHRSLLFSYILDGKTYKKVIVLDHLSKKEHVKFFEGETYTIYVDEKRPRNICCTTRKYYADEIFLIVWIGGISAASFLAIAYATVNMIVNMVK